MSPGDTDKQILVPLTTSLYVPGKLADTQNVIVDVGTGYFIEKVWTSGPHARFLTDIVCGSNICRGLRKDLLLLDYERCRELLQPQGG